MNLYTAKIGMITPSSNTTLEPVTMQMAVRLPVSIHFARLPVTRISLDPQDLSQFTEDRMLVAARLLADAHVDLIVWNGTSAGWLGESHDRELCQRISAATGVRATTTTLLQWQAFDALGAQRIGLAVPYQEDVAGKIRQTYQQAGYYVVHWRALGICDNVAFSQVPEETIRNMVREVSRNVDAISIYCTNFPGAPLVESLEQELGVPIVDSVTMTLWGALQQLGVSSQITGWGRLMQGSR